MAVVLGHEVCSGLLGRNGSLKQSPKCPPSAPNAPLELYLLFSHCVPPLELFPQSSSPAQCRALQQGVMVFAACVPLHILFPQWSSCLCQSDSHSSFTIQLAFMSPSVRSLPCPLFPGMHLLHFYISEFIILTASTPSAPPHPHHHHPDCEAYTMLFLVSIAEKYHSEEAENGDIQRQCRRRTS